MLATDEFPLVVFEAADQGLELGEDLLVLLEDALLAVAGTGLRSPSAGNTEAMADPRLRLRGAMGVIAALVFGAACGAASDDGPTSASTVGRGSAASPPTSTAVSETAGGSVRLTVSEVASGLDTPWALAWDADDRLWFTERSGRLTQLGGTSREVPGVVEQGESGLTGLEFDGQGRALLLYSTGSDNRIIRSAPDALERAEVLVDGIPRAAIHNGGPLQRGPDGAIYASTGDADEPDTAQDPSSLGGKVLRLDPASGAPEVFSLGHRNAQGLCFAPDGRFLSTEHGPTGRDEVNVLQRGFNGGWPDTAGNGIRNYPQAIAPAGCVVYDAALIPQWRGSMLFATLRGTSLHRLTFGPDGAVAGEEVLFDDEFGRLRDVEVGPDGAVYITTSNRDGRGSPDERDDRILRIAPSG